MQKNEIQSLYTPYTRTNSKWNVISETITFLDEILISKLLCDDDFLYLTPKTKATKVKIYK